MAFLKYTVKYSRNQNNVNILNCNCKEITNSYSEITECNMSHSMPNVGITFKILKL